MMLGIHVAIFCQLTTIGAILLIPIGFTNGFKNIIKPPGQLRSLIEYWGGLLNLS